MSEPNPVFVAPEATVTSATTICGSPDSVASTGRTTCPTACANRSPAPSMPATITSRTASNATSAAALAHSRASHVGSISDAPSRTILFHSRPASAHAASSDPPSADHASARAPSASSTRAKPDQSAIAQPIHSATANTQVAIGTIGRGLNACARARSDGRDAEREVASCVISCVASRTAPPDAPDGAPRPGPATAVPPSTPVPCSAISFPHCDATRSLGSR
jgi:hypothetical protein